MGLNMENRLELNKKPIYELPDEVIIGEYMYNKDKKRYREPNFEPDICINSWGDILGEVIPKKSKALQIWIKTDNKELIDFISNFNWYSVCPSHNNSPVLAKWKFKKIMLEEFYNKKD